MRRQEIAKLERELEQFLHTMVEGMGRPERRRAIGDYVTGLLLDGERKSIEPMAARLVESAAEAWAMRQRLQQCVSASGWSDQEMFRRLAVKLEKEMPGAEALVIDDTGFPKKGVHSVGVQRQYSGTLGRIDNCQVAVSLHLAGEPGSGCIGLRLYLPEAWASNRARRAETSVPKGIEFQHKWEIALDLLDDALEWGVRKHLLLSDAGYGDTREFRDGVTKRGLLYVMGVQGSHVVWPPGCEPQVPERESGKPGRPRTNYRAEDRTPVAISELAATLRYRTVSWREGSRGRQSGRFVAVRIRTAERGKPPSEEQWLLCQRLDNDKPKYWLSTLSTDTAIEELVRCAKLRWRVERDYQEMKQEIGLDHFEGRTWRGFHHHATLCAVAHGFLALRRALFPPEQSEVDARDGAEVSSAGAPALGGDVSALLPTGHNSYEAARTLTDVSG